MASNRLSGDDMQNIKTTMKSQNLGNTTDVEWFWVKKATEHADVYFKLITSVDPSLIRLTKVDSEIYAKFRETFPDMKVDVLDENAMKSEESKKVWRDFIEEFRDKVQDYNYGTLLRLNCGEGYTEENTTFSVRTQFLAIEIARNKEKHNDGLRFTHGNQKAADPSIS